MVNVLSQGGRLSAAVPPSRAGRSGRGAVGPLSAQATRVAAEKAAARARNRRRVALDVVGTEASERVEANRCHASGGPTYTQWLILLRGVTVTIAVDMVLVLALLRDRQCRARWEEAVRGYGRMGYCERASELAPRVLAAKSVAAIVVEPCDDMGSSTAPLVGALRRDFPRIPVVAYCDHRRDRSTDILALARAGVHELVFRGADDVRPVLTSALASAVRHCTATELLEELQNVLPPNVVPVVRYCLEHAAEPLTVQRIANALGVHRKTLVYRLRQARLPAPRAVIAWCRLLVAARLLEDPGRTVEQVALDLDFPSGTALRNMIKRHTGLRPAELRARGGERAVRDAFVRLLTRARVAPPALAS